jgi:hypothetical protein
VEAVTVTRRHSQGGTILAFGKENAGGDLTRFGAKGTNNYNDFYQSKTVYK